MTPRQIYLVDDHPMIREGYASLIDTTDDLAVCGEAADGAQALEGVAAAAPDLVVVDMNLPGMPGLDVVRQLTARYPDLAVLVVSGHAASTHADDAREAGARAYLEKQRAATELLSTIRTILGVAAR